MRRKRYRRKIKRATAPRAIEILVISIIELLICAVAVFFQINGIFTEYFFVFAIAGCVSIIVSFICLVFGIREITTGDYNLWSRIAQLVVPIVSFVVWVGIYLLGFMSL